MISESRIEKIEESVTGAELFENIIDAFSVYGFDDIDGNNIVTPLEITQADYDELPSSDTSSYIYLVTDG